MADASDAAILRYAREQGLIVVTLDADFHRLLAFAGASDPSVIRIRIEGLRGEELCRLLIQVIDRCKGELEQGALVSVSEAGLRLRHLPLPN
jgi:predicted nuclease of predicted toxin-antitoxin system